MTRILSQYWRIILFIITLFLILWMIWNLLNTLLPFFIGLILAYLLYPVIRWVEKRLPAKGRLTQTKRILLILLIYLLVLTAVGLTAFFMIPLIINSVSDFFENSPQIISDFVARVQGWTDSLRQSIPEQIRQPVDDYLANIAGTIANAVQSALVSVFSLLTASFGFILGFVSLPVFLFYLLKDAENLNEGFYAALPLWLREHTQGVVNIFRNVLGRYVRSSIVLGLAVGILDFIGLMILGIPFAPALAFWAGLTEMVPILGPWLGAAAGIIVTLATDPGKIVWVAALYLIVQMVENNLLVPRIHSQYLNLHPAFILVLVVLGAHFAGLWGVILIVPVTATFISLYKYLHHSIREESKMGR